MQTSNHLHGNITCLIYLQSCQNSRELESDCGNYCFKAIRPVLDHTKALQSQVDDFINEKKLLANLENLNKSYENKIQKQLETLDKKIEDLHRSNEIIIQTKFELLDKKLEDLSKMLEVKKSTVGKPFQKIGSKYYYIEQSENLSWFGAVNKCLRLGGHLANIKDQAEFNAIIAKLEPNKRYWIDINDLGTEGIFISGTTGLKATYLVWHPNNPDNYQNNEHCGCLWFHDKYLMNDDNCNSNMLFICESDNE